MSSSILLPSSIIIVTNVVFVGQVCKVQLLEVYKRLTISLFDRNYFLTIFTQLLKLV